MINPLDIRKHEFTRAWRGYDRDEVRALLDALAREFEEAARRSASLSERLKTAEEQIERYRLTEKTLQDAAVTLQQAMEEKRRTAELEASRLIDEARSRASGEEAEGRARLAALRAELQALEDEKARFVARVRGMLRNQLEMLGSPSEPEDGRAFGASES